MLNAPTHGTIQYHPSLLPRHRGPSAINWAIIQGDEKTGLAIFWPDDGLDTGPVLMTKEVEITPDDTLGSLYFDKLFPLGVEAMVESVDLVREGRAPRIAQVEEDATYESWCRRKTSRSTGRARSRDVHNLIRGADPRPGAWTTIDGEEVGILDAERIDDDPGAAPGEVVAVDGDRLVVAADGGAIAVGVVRAGRREDGGRRLCAGGRPARRRAARRRRPEGRLTPSATPRFAPAARVIHRR